jgi:hypothetical protein
VVGRGGRRGRLGGDFGAFRAALLAAPPTVVETPATGATGPHGGFTVAWESPSQGPLTFGTESPFTVDGAPRSLRAEARYDNPWMQVPWGAEEIVIGDGQRSLTLDQASLDLTAWDRRPR